MAADRKCEIASNVQSGLALPLARRQARFSMTLNIRHRKAARDRQARTPRVLGHHQYSRALPASLADGARGDSDGHPQHRRRDVGRGTRTTRYQPLFVVSRRRPCSQLRSGDVHGTPTRRNDGSFLSFPKSLILRARRVQSARPHLVRAISRPHATPSPPRAAQRRGLRLMMRRPGLQCHRRCRAPACRSGTGSRRAR